MIALSYFSTMTDKKFPDVPKEAIVKPEDEKPSNMEVRTEEVENKDERLKSADPDMDSNDNPDVDQKA
jgi:hypothetical protein